MRQQTEVKVRVLEREAEQVKLVLEDENDDYLYTISAVYSNNETQVLSQSKTLLWAEERYNRHLADMRADGWQPLTANLNRADYCEIQGSALSQGDWVRGGDRLSWAFDAIAHHDSALMQSWLRRFGVGAYQDMGDLYLHVAAEASGERIDDNDPLYEEKRTLRNIWAWRVDEDEAAKMAEDANERMLARCSDVPGYWH